LGSRRKARLGAIARRPSSPQSLVRRARIVLLAHQGWPNAQIAAELGCSAGTVRAWRRRFVRGGIPVLADRPRSGRPGVYGPDVRLAIVAAATSAPKASRINAALGPSAWVGRAPRGVYRSGWFWPEVGQAGGCCPEFFLAVFAVGGW
jgi:transposase-like protein